jgi:iron(III) transport system ATP-binding protein
MADRHTLIRPSLQAPAPPPPYLRLIGLTKVFGEVLAVAAVDLTVARGEFVVLLGPSGCGKTTILRLIAGFERPDAGQIELAGHVVAGPGLMTPPERRRVGLVFQDYALFPHLDVAGNIAFGLPRAAGREQRIAELLALVGLPGQQRRMPHELSGGQQQRVALARALGPKPEILLLDEPFSNLDSALRAQVRTEVRQILMAAGVTSIMVTHDQAEALSLADRVAVMAQGRIVQVEAPVVVYQQPATRRVALLVGEANLLAGEADGTTVACALGRLPLARPTRGPVDVLVRPEALTVLPTLEGDPEGTALVVSVAFFGHDQVALLRLASGDTVRARLGPRLRLSAGQPVTVAYDGEVLAFPRDSA